MLPQAILCPTNKSALVPIESFFQAPETQPVISNKCREHSFDAIITVVPSAPQRVRLGEVSLSAGKVEDEIANKVMELGC